jgi:DNA-binding transcriptional MerR regulator
MTPKARVQKRLYYKIGEACKALDIQPYVLRYWETEFPALSPNKSRSGQRVYSEKEIGIIRRIKELLYGEGYTIAGAKKKLEGEIASGSLEGADEGDEPGPETAEEPRLPGTGETAVAAAGTEAAPAPPARSTPRARAPRAAALPPALPLDATIPPGGGPEQQPLLLDTHAAERIESMRKGIRQAVNEAREILVLLTPKSPPRSSV